VFGRQEAFGVQEVFGEFGRIFRSSGVAGVQEFRQ
jgi:hypothetical protein